MKGLYSKANFNNQSEKSINYLVTDLSGLTPDLHMGNAFFTWQCPCERETDAALWVNVGLAQVSDTF